MSRIHARCIILTAVIGTFTTLRSVSADAPRRLAEGVQDNSFLVEEAYNQEPGVVQHILNVTRNVNKLRGSDDRAWSFAFTQEWPIVSQTHQFSYTVPYTFAETGGQSDNGFEDVLLNYRVQALVETDTTPAFAPRLSLVVPTGDSTQGFGNNRLGYQINLPVSKVLSDRWSVHGNTGATFLPDVQGHNLANYNLGASAIYAMGARFNLMLEAIATWDAEVDDNGQPDRSFFAIVSPGLRYAFNHDNGAQTVVGLAAPVGLTSAAPDYGVILYFSFEHAFTKSALKEAFTK